MFSEWSWNRDPLACRPSPDSRCRDTGLSAEGRICPVGPPALRRLCAPAPSPPDFSPQRLRPPPQLPGEGGPGPTSGAPGLGFARTRDQGPVREAPHPLIHYPWIQTYRDTKKYTQTESHTSAPQVPPNSKTPKPVKSLRNLETHTDTQRGHDDTHTEKDPRHNTEAQRRHTKKYAPTWSDRHRDTHKDPQNYRGYRGTDGPADPHLHTRMQANQM